MNKFISKILIVSSFVVFSVISAFSQSEKQDKPDFFLGRMFGVKNKIIYAKKNDKLPDSIKAKGEIVDASLNETYCGLVGTGGTLKIRLTEKVENYNYEYLYVIVLCVAGKENKNLVGENIEIEVKKMTKYPYNSSVVLASLDSNGIPFYFSTVDGTGGLIKKLKSKSSETSK